MDVQAQNSGDYEYLDAGDGERLERFGKVILARPAAPALWRRERPELWDRADGIFTRHSDGSGKWDFKRRVPEEWTMRWDDLIFHLKPTGFGHTGLFPEHAAHWDWITRQIRNQSGACRVIHLFAYTGAMSLIAARAGAEVCHVDAVPDINDWARRNAAASGLKDAPIRWISDDVTKFVAREIRRGRKYDGIIFDPPSYGKGTHGEKWILEEHLTGLLDLLPQVAVEKPRFVLFTCHTLGFSPVLMHNLMTPWQDKFGGKVESGTMMMGNTSCRCKLPSGFFARWVNDTSQ